MLVFFLEGVGDESFAFEDVGDVGDELLAVVVELVEAFLQFVGVGLFRYVHGMTIAIKGDKNEANIMGHCRP